ncbi:hypothetical protein TWF481_006469 [Arthrobotrys musiformis]|uniref:Peptidase metallopeptidase domain-containing protein n=1 Tax=Arthrobotrys musiformis TaxID=47236 RepID=A0AAV9WAB6_9PEZI
MDVGNREANMEYRWKAGQTIKIRLMGRSRHLRRKVIRFARQWEKYANIRFNFLGNNSIRAEVRVTFTEGKGNYSYLGTSALDIPENEPTMNLELDDFSSTDYVRRVVLYEFGHLLGCIYEYSSPASGISWNVPAVYQYYKTNFGWDETKTYQSVIYKYDKSMISQFTEFDPKSIMVYYIDESHLLPGED